MNERTGDDFSSRPGNLAFWEELQQTFETAIDLLQEIADAQGIEVAVPGEAAVQSEEARLDAEARNHELVQRAAEYGEEVDVWFRRAKEAVREWGINATRKAEENGLTCEIEKEADDLQEALESLADARYRIGVKLARAVRCRLREDSAVLAPMSGAAEKAVAEAYVLAEDSIRFWMRLREIIPSEEDAILHLLIQLSRLREGMMAEFDGAFTASDLDEDGGSGGSSPGK